MSNVHSKLIKKITTTTETEFYTGCNQCDCNITTYPYTNTGTDTDHCVPPWNPEDCCEPLRLVKKEKDINIIEEYAPCYCPCPQYFTTPPEITTIPDKPTTTLSGKPGTITTPPEVTTTPIEGPGTTTPSNPSIKK